MIRLDIRLCVRFETEENKVNRAIDFKNYIMGQFILKEDKKYRPKTTTLKTQYHIDYIFRDN